LKELKISLMMRFGTITPNKKRLADIIEKLCIIIQKQNNLENFMISQSYLLNNDIFMSLELQKNSLVSIEFSYIDFSNISFKNLLSKWYDGESL
jgi:hypothetical protein